MLLFYLNLLYMDFKHFINKKINSFGYEPNEEFTEILNYIIYVICIRLMNIIVHLTNHCQKKVIKKDSINYAFQIELKNISYKSSSITSGDIPYLFLDNIFRSKVITNFLITKGCLLELSKLLDYLIHFYIQSSIINNNLNISALLNQLKINNIFLYRYIVSKYNLKGHVRTFI